MNKVIQAALPPGIPDVLYFGPGRREAAARRGSPGGRLGSRPHPADARRRPLPPRQVAASKGLTVLIWPQFIIISIIVLELVPWNSDAW